LVPFETKVCQSFSIPCRKKEKEEKEEKKKASQAKLTGP